MPPVSGFFTFHFILKFKQISNKILEDVHGIGGSAR